MVVNEVIESAALSLAFALENLVQQEKLQELVCTFIGQLNDVYTVRAQPDIAKRDEKEKEVQNRATMLLTDSISLSVKERLDQEPEQREVNDAIANLRLVTEAWTASVREGFQALTTMNLTTEEARAKSTAIRDAARAFLQAQTNKEDVIGTNQWKATNQKEVSSRYNKVALHAKQLIDQISYVESEMIILLRALQRLQGLNFDISGDSAASRQIIEGALRQLNFLLPKDRFLSLQTLYHDLSNTMNDPHLPADARRTRARELMESILANHLTKHNLDRANYPNERVLELQGDLRNCDALIHNFTQACTPLFEKVRFVNIDPIPRQSLNEHATSLMYSTIKKYLDELIFFARRQEITPSLFTHMFLIPHLQYTRQQRGR
jgi:hypothetical protein